MNRYDYINKNIKIQGGSGMLKVKEVKRWDSVGDEFLRKLESHGIEYKVLYERLNVFELATLGVAGGKIFDILDYKRKSDGQRVIVAHGGFGVGDVAVEEIYVIEVGEDEVVKKEDIIETLRDYIKKEEESQIV